MKQLIFSIIFVFACSSGIRAQGYDEINKVAASDRAQYDEFGKAVSISGNYAIIGAYAGDGDEGGMNILPGAGCAYIFERDANGNWIERQKLVASDRATIDLFGFEVSISGNYAIVGAYQEDEDSLANNTLSLAGSAYIFERDTNGYWVEKQKIVPSDRQTNDKFGYSVSISNNYAIIGALEEDDDVNGANFLSSAGSAYIFERNSTGSWIETQKIVASDRDSNDFFSRSVSISGDEIIVGAYGDGEDILGANSMPLAGSAYIFERDVGGTWIEKQKIVPLDRDTNDYFGFTVSISEGNAIVGAYKEEEDSIGLNNFFLAGSVYIFERDSTGNWNQQQKIVASDRATNDIFGWMVSIFKDKAIVAACYEAEDANGANSLPIAGSAYIFERDISGIWNQIRKIVASDRAGSDQFGWAVSISEDNAIVGANYESEDANGANTLLYSGSAYIFGDTCFIPIVTVPTISGCDSVLYMSNTYFTDTTVTSILTSMVNGCDSSIIQPIDVVDCTGLHETADSPSFRIYPNPNNGQFEIEIFEDFRNASIVIADAIGKVIHYKAIIEKQVIVELTSLKSGIYFVRINSEKGISTRRLIIKN